MEVTNILILLIIFILIPATCSIVAVWNDDIGKGAKFSITISLFIAMVSVLCVIFDTSYCLDKIDFVGVISSIISIPTAVVVGWNIYAIIDVKSIRKDFETWKSDAAKDIEKDMEEYINDAIIKEKIDMIEHFIQLETTLCNAYVKTKEWDKVLPLLSNKALRYYSLSKQNGYEINIEGFVSSVAQIFDELKNLDKDEFSKYRSKLAGFMENIKQLQKFDNRISKIYEEAQDYI